MSYQFGYQFVNPLPIVGKMLCYFYPNVVIFKIFCSIFFYRLAPCPVWGGLVHFVTPSRFSFFSGVPCGALVGLIGEPNLSPLLLIHPWNMLRLLPMCVLSWSGHTHYWNLLWVLSSMALDISSPLASNPLSNNINGRLGLFLCHSDLLQYTSLYIWTRLRRFLFSILWCSQMPFRRRANSIFDCRVLIRLVFVSVIFLLRWTLSDVLLAGPSLDRAYANAPYHGEVLVSANILSLSDVVCYSSSKMQIASFYNFLGLSCCDTLGWGSGSQTIPTDCITQVQKWPILSGSGSPTASVHSLPCSFGLALAPRLPLHILPGVSACEALSDNSPLGIASRLLRHAHILRSRLHTAHSVRTTPL